MPRDFLGHPVHNREYNMYFEGIQLKSDSKISFLPEEADFLRSNRKHYNSAGPVLDIFMVIFGHLPI